MGLRRKARSERGAALVEFALLLPVFMMLVLGMFSGGLAYNQKIELTHAAREGARFAATQPATQLFASGTWATNMRDVTRLRANGEVTDNQICVALVAGSGLGTPVSNNHIWKGSDSGVPPGNGSGCYDDGTVDPTNKERRVQVLLRRDGRLEALFFDMKLNLRGRAVADHEAL